MKSTCTLGPYFVAAHDATPPSHRLESLGLAVEWSTPAAARTLPLFRHRPAHAPPHLRLENILVSANQLPFAVVCPEYLILPTADHTFLPLEALLAGLYRRRDVGRSICAVLTELSSLVPLHSAVTHPVSESGLLIASVTWACANNTFSRDGSWLLGLHFFLGLCCIDFGQ
jgi:hypothetical protein